ncbi:hypothetical protein ABT186_01695 [Streptomyces sp. NPDC001634]|uniref:hypothetical protein n=1 Tax=Streptomyces sp. NPDC001634 TaxID=3154390 RepID=UPI00332CF92E
MTTEHVAHYACYRRGCRRDECRTADRKYRKQYELRRLSGIPAHIPGPVVAAHLRLLTDSGHTIRGISGQANVSERAMNYILNGQAKVTRPKALALLAIQPLNEAPRVDPIGSIRRIQALAAIGWPIIWTAEQSGYHPSYLFNIIAGRVHSIPRHVAHRFTVLYREYSHQAGPSGFTRSVARRNNWHGPLAWDAIDDPNEQPEIVVDRVLNFHERAKLRREEIEHLAWCGHEPEQIRARLNNEVSIATVRQVVQEWRTGQKRQRKAVAA